MEKPPEPDESGLLHHRHHTDDYQPDAHHLDENPSSALVEETAQQSHHGLLREPSVRAKISREEEAKLALEHTQITWPMCWTLTALFLLTIVSVPIVQAIVEVRRNLAERRGQEAHAPVAPRFFEVLGELPSKEKIGAVRNFDDAWNLIPSASQFRKHEDQLQDDSLVVQWTLPRVQNGLLQVGVGNEQAYVGRERWLMYRPDVDYLTSRGFLDPALLKVRQRAGDSDSEVVQPNPVRAIVDFKNQLAARGIDLIVMPVPVKPMIHAEKMAARYDWQHPPLQNPSYEQFRRTLQQNNVKLFDISALLLEAKRRSAQAQYLQTDTHWTPTAMEQSARELAAFIRRHSKLPPHASEGYTRGAAKVSNIGDIAEMLRLPAEQKWYARQPVMIQPVKTSEGELWYYRRDADILLLGDSFSNIYSFAAMNWGESAGLGEQLSYHLQRPLDSIINNAGGSHVTRQLLARELARGKDRLRGKRLVIWEFSMRDLLIGDWKLIQLPKGKS
jgi:alginate O-acetyltransferase complex protein AlgJ